jgi:predicted alpha/beta-fold hydrolase
VAAVNPPIELATCADAIESPENRVYQAYYVLRLYRQLRRIARVGRPVGPPPVLTRIRTVRRFDEIYTAPDGGYGSADEYYALSSAAPTLSELRRPAMVLSAVDDPFVPAGMFSSHHGNRRIRFLQPPHGGHCGYWQSGSPRFWAAEAILDFIDAP